MQRIDLLIGGALLLAIVLSIAGAATYEDERRGSAFTVTWRTQTLAGDVAAQTATATEFPFNMALAAQNLTTVTFAFDIAAPAARAQPTAVRIEVTPPNATEPHVAEGSVPAGGPTGVVFSVPFEVGVLPTTRTTTGASPEDAIVTLTRDHATSNGTGEWRAVVLLAPGAPGPLGGLETYTVSVTAELVAYFAEVQIQTPEVGR